jgi:hypothetical protein
MEFMVISKNRLPELCIPFEELKDFLRVIGPTVSVCWMFYLMYFSTPFAYPLQS